MVTAVARVHTFFHPLMVLRPTLVGAVVGLILFFATREPIRSFRAIRHPVSSLVLFLLAWSSLGAPLAIYKTQAVMFLFDEAYKVGVLFLLVAASVRSVGDVRRLFYSYGWAAAGLAAYSLVHGRMDHEGRLGGGGGYDPNDLAMVLVSALPIAIYALARARKPQLKIAAALSIAVLAIATVRTSSRGGFIALAAVIGYALFMLRGVKPSWRLLAFGGVIGLLGYAGSVGYWERMRSITEPGTDYNTSSLTGRLEVWKRGMGYMLAHPIFGVGIDNFQTAEGRSQVIVERESRGLGTRWSPPHSAWVQVGAELGLPGLVAFMAIFWYCITYLRRLSRLATVRGPPLVEEAAALASALLGVLVGLMVAASFLTQAFGYALWATFGLVVGLAKVTGAQLAQPEAARPRIPRRPPAAGPPSNRPALPRTARRR